MATGDASSIGSHHNVVVIGGGQAGLAMSYCLQAARDRARRAREEPRRARMARAPLGFVLPGDAQLAVPPARLSVQRSRSARLHAEGRDRPVPRGLRALLRAAAARRGRGDPPARRAGAANGGFDVSTTAGDCFAEQVVVATGGYHTPRVPRWAERLPEAIAQLHSSQYRNPQSLPPGEVLVVGTGQSGCQIAEDLHLAGRRVHLAVGGAPRTARRYRGRDVVDWLEDMGYYSLPVHEHPLKERVRAKANHYVTGRDGGRDIDLRQRAREGMRLYGHVEGARGTRLLLVGRSEAEPGSGRRRRREHQDQHRQVHRRPRHRRAGRGALSAGLGAGGRDARRWIWRRHRSPR